MEIGVAAGGLLEIVVVVAVGHIFSSSSWVRNRPPPSNTADRNIYTLILDALLLKAPWKGADLKLSKLSVNKFNQI